MIRQLTGHGEFMVCMELFSGFCSVPTLSTYSVYGADLFLVCFTRIGKASTEESRCIGRVGPKKNARLARSFPAICWMLGEYE